MALLGLCLVPASAGTKPPESTSKIKKVLLYNKIGGWVTVNGRAEVKAVFSTLAAAKGFELAQADTDTVLTSEYLKEFQAIVWNNNSDGGRSVPSLAARQAVLDYLDQGGGWMLICNAGDHVDSWPGLAERLGTKFTVHARIDRAEVVMDSAARSHRELMWMSRGFPDAFELNDLFFSFRNTVRPLPGVTVVATARGIPGIEGVVKPVADGSGDNVYIWAREVGKGRLFYNAIGFGFNRIMEQQDSIVPRLYWESLRYVAGDYQNGCTTPGRPGFDPAARVHVEDRCAPTAVKASPSRFSLVVSRGSMRIRLPHSLSGPFTVRVWDIRGAKVWEQPGPAGTGEIVLDRDLGPGVYHVELEEKAGNLPEPPAASLRRRRSGHRNRGCKWTW